MVQTGTDSVIVVGYLGEDLRLTMALSHARVRIKEEEEEEEEVTSRENSSFKPVFGGVGLLDPVSLTTRSSSRRFATPQRKRLRVLGILSCHGFIVDIVNLRGRRRPRPLWLDAARSIRQGISLTRILGVCPP